MNNLPFQIILGLLQLGFIAHRGYYSNKNKRSGQDIIRSSANTGTPFTNILAGLALISSLVFIFKPVWMEWSSIGLPAWPRWLGTALTLGGFALLQWSQITLGENWNDESVIFQDHKLVSSGPYRWIRHPIYSAFLLILGSSILISDNWFLELAWLGMVSLDVIGRIQAEEELLEDEFGESFQEYQNSTGRLIPILFKKWRGEK